MALLYLLANPLRGRHSRNECNERRGVLKNLRREEKLRGGPKRATNGSLYPIGKRMNLSTMPSLICVRNGKA